MGTMTQYLAEAAREVVAVEIDRNLLPILQETLADYDNVKGIHADVLSLLILKNWCRRRMAADRSRLWRIFRIILRRRLLWDYLSSMYRWPM